MTTEEEFLKDLSRRVTEYVVQIPVERRISLYHRISEELGLDALTESLIKLQESSRPLVDYLVESAKNDYGKNLR
jgi:hypothetical protein